MLDITLTSRGDGVPLAGVPVQAAAEYLRQLVAAGHRVAICEQVEDPKLAKGIVRREVVETITPGAMLDEGWIPADANNSSWRWPIGRERRRQGVGLAAIDLSTGEFLLETLAPERLDEAIGRLRRRVVVTAETAHRLTARRPSVLRTERDAWEFDPALAATTSPAASASPRSTGSASRPPTPRPWARPARCSATSTELQPAGLRHLSRPVVAPQRRASSGSTR